MTSDIKEIDLRTLKGVVATVNLTGSIMSETHAALAEMRAWCVENGFTNVEWMVQPAQLVEAGRDSVCQHALNEGYDWMLQVDGDAAPIPPDALFRMLKTAFVDLPNADAVGAYAQLKGGVNICTIDTGSGTWEPHFPGEGVLPVIRTGGHFILVKTSALRKFGPPWFKTRTTLRPIEALSEVDNYARIKLRGKNPFSSSEEWKSLSRLAREEAASGPSSVGEDSGFCDALKAAGGEIYVDTNLVVGHVAKKVIMPSDLKRGLQEREKRMRASVGVYA